MNERFTVIYGYSREEAIGKTTLELGLYADHDRDRLVSERNSKGVVRNIEFRALRKDGDIRVVLLSSSLLLEDGKHLHLHVIRDITLQRRAEDEKRALEEQFRQAQKLECVGRLAGGVAHDFNNLLTVINGYGDLLLTRCKEGDPLRDMVVEIRNAGERAAGLTRHLLTFSRKQVVEKKPVDIGSLVSENCNMFSRLLGEDIELVTKLAPGVGEVVADTGQLHQVLMNLVVNARDAMPDGGRLTIETLNVELDRQHASTHPEICPGPFVLLRVGDTGSGIPDEIKGRIFDPFFTTKSEGAGTGLGLSTTYGIIRQFGGVITVTSQAGRGTTFEILLPRLEPVQTANRVGTGTAGILHGSETVLVVEDQEAVRRLTVDTLKSFGYQVLEASNGVEALRVGKQYAGPIHLLLTDVVMPRMTGKELAEVFLPSRPESKLIYMSGYAADTMIEKGLLQGATYLAKPFSPTPLAAKVREVLGPVRAPLTVLVVDDEPGVRDYLEHTLCSAGYHVVTAGDGRAALEIASRLPIDILVTDLVMPEQEGIETIQLFRRRHPTVKIIAMSGAFAGEFLGMAAMLGASATLLKPFAPDALINVVQRVAGSA